MPAALTCVSAFDQIKDAVRSLEEVLHAQMEKKLKDELNEQDTRQEKNKIIHGFNRLIDLHMIAYSTTTESKRLTTEAKNDMNVKRVELQDVMYERRHILEEIVQCRQFRSVYQDVELIPEQEFRTKAEPEFLQNADNEHQLMINRFKYELVLRRELKERKEALEAEKMRLIKENRIAQRKVDQLDKLLDDFVLSAVPVEEALLMQENTDQKKASRIEPMDTAVDVNIETVETCASEVMDTTL